MRRIIELFEDKNIDLIITNYTLSQLNGSEYKIDEFLKFCNHIKLKYIYLNEFFELNIFKILTYFQKIKHPGRIILNDKNINIKLGKYKFYDLKTKYNSFGVKMTQRVYVKEI